MDVFLQTCNKFNIIAWFCYLCKNVLYALAVKLLCTLLLCICLGGAHRCYESRRRVYNDSRPERREQVQKNLKVKKRKSYQTGVCLIRYFVEFLVFLL